MGSGGVMDASAAASPAALAVATMNGSGVFPAASARGATGVPESRVTAAAAAAIPPDGAGGTVEARGGVCPTPRVDWTTDHHHQRPEVTTTQQRRIQVTPAVTSSGSRRNGVSGAFAMLDADEEVIRNLATGPEADGDPEMTVVLA